MRNYYEYLNDITSIDDALAESYIRFEAIDPSDIESIDNSVVQELQEFVITVPLIIGIILAAPGIIELLAKVFSKLSSAIKKLFKRDTTNDSSDISEKILTFAHKWHKLYITLIRKTLSISGIFKKAGITDKSEQKKAAEVVFYTIVFGFAIYGGITTAKGIGSTISKVPAISDIAGISLEGILTAIKSSEVKQFINKLT